MGGDLNLKKSWHPVLMSNQRKVWEEEKKALEERKRIDQMMKERQEERQIQELQDMQEAAGGKKRLNRVDWMYSGPSSGQAGTTEEMEGYLLGKRRIDGLIKTTENKKLEKAGADEETFIALQNANTTRDTAAKIRDDPMLAIKRQEQAAYEAIMKDPARRAALLQAAGGGAAEPAPEKKHRKHRHRECDSGHHRREEDRHSSKRRRVNNEDRPRRSRTDDEDRSRRERGSRKYRSESYSQSPPPHRRRSPSPSHAFKRSPPRGRRSRSPESYPSNDRYDRDSRKNRDERKVRNCDVNGDRSLKHSKSWHEPRSSATFQNEHQSSPPRSADDRAAKLATMQQAANDLDKNRENRIKAIAEREAAQRETEDAQRARSIKYGGKGEFMHGMNRRAGELSIGDRVQRGKGGLEIASDG